MGALALLLLFVAPREIPASIELVPERAQVFVHEPVRLALRVWIEEEFFTERVVQPFLRPLDLPLEVQTAGLRELTNAELLAESGSVRAPGPRFALDDAPARAERLEDLVRDGRRLRGYEHGLVLVPTRPGPLELPAPRLRLVHTSGFREDFLGGRVPIDRHEDVWVGAAPRLDVRPLPEAGRPAAFSGGVGQFELAARLMDDRVVLGESARLVLRIVGDGQLARIEPPRLDALADFHLFGLLDETTDGERRLVYDLAPRSVGVRAVPPIELWTFDPRPPGAYRRLVTPALALEVLPAPDDERGPGPAPESSDAPSPQAGDGSSAKDSDRTPFAPLAAGLALLALAAWVLGIRRLRRVAAQPADSRGAPSDVPPGPRTDAEGRLGDRLAALLGVPPASLIDPALAERLVRAGVDRAAATRSARLLEELIAMRYGGPAVERAQEQVTTLLAELPLPGPQPVARAR